MHLLDLQSWLKDDRSFERCEAWEPSTIVDIAKAVADKMMSGDLLYREVQGGS
jgi:hypothetical protein